MSKKKKSKKLAPSQTSAYRYYGIVKLKKGQKLAWFSQENKHGWSLGLALEKRTIWLRNIRFASKAEVLRAVDSKSVVFIEKKGE